MQTDGGGCRSWGGLGRDDKGSDTGYGGDVRVEREKTRWRRSQDEEVVMVGVCGKVEMRGMWIHLGKCEKNEGIGK